MIKKLLKLLKCLLYLISQTIDSSTILLLPWSHVHIGNVEQAGNGEIYKGIYDIWCYY